MDNDRKGSSRSKEASCQSYEQFTANKCPNGRWIVLRRVEDDNFVYKRVYVNCGTFSCPYCRRIKRKKLKRLIDQACPKDKFSMLTLTLKYNSDTLENNWKRINKLWDTLLKRLRRKSPDIKYFRCVELTKNGMPHIHALINFYLPKWYIQKIWKKITGDSFITRFEKVRSSCSGYILKYFEQSVNDIAYIRHATGKKTRIFNWSRLLLAINNKKKEWDLVAICDNKFEAILILQTKLKSSRTLHGRVGPPEIWNDEGGMIEILTYRSVELMNIKDF